MLVPSTRPGGLSYEFPASVLVAIPGSQHWRPGWPQSGPGQVLGGSSVTHLFLRSSSLEAASPRQEAPPRSSGPGGDARSLARPDIPAYSLPGVVRILPGSA